jgi:hypothetical protein
MNSADLSSEDMVGDGGNIASLAGSSRYVVAVHGIGDQFKNATIQSVVAAFGGFFNYPTGIPLGAFRSPRPTVQPWKVPSPSTIDAVPVPPALADTAFVEIYWADIPRKQQKAGYVIEDTKAWARTVVARLRARYQEFTDEKRIAALKPVQPENCHPHWARKTIALLPTPSKR